jgi:serine/threonine protein kinase
MKIGTVTILEELGKGAGSRVFRVRREEDSGEYALKIVPCESQRSRRYLEQVQNEFEIGRYLNHPNLIKIYGLETDVGWFSGPKCAKLLPEYAPGRAMDRLPLLPIPRLLRVFERISSALAHMHDQNVIHADIKPNNLILDTGANVKVIDFGIAQPGGERRERVHATREFMAPETCKHKVINARTDIYNFGATMYKLSTLHAPPPALTAVFKGEREFERRYLPAKAVNPRVPTAFSDLIGDCLTYNPDLRPKSMKEIGNTLARLAQTGEDAPE